MVQGATLHYQQMPNTYSNYMMGGYPQQQQIYQQNQWSASRSVPQMQYTAQQQPAEATTLYTRRAASQQHSNWSQQQQQQQQQQQHQQQQLIPTSAAPSLPPLSQLFSSSSQNSQQGQQQAPQQTQNTQMQQQQPDASASMSVSQSLQNQNLQAYQQNAQQYTDVNAPYVTLALADGSAYVSQAAQPLPMNMQAQLTAQSLPPIQPASSAVEIVATQLPTQQQQAIRNNQAQQAMLAINTAMLPTSDAATATPSPVAMSPLQNASNTFTYPQYSTATLHHSLMSNPAVVGYGASVPAAAVGSIGHRRTISASSAASTTSTQHDDDDSSSSSGEHSQHHKVFSFVSLPGVNTKKRPRRKFDEIERHYQCNWQGCTKSYGTLNHLNAHVSMQKHGAKRVPSEFKELRKQWRRQKREEAAKRMAEDAAHNSSHASTPNKVEDE